MKKVFAAAMALAMCGMYAFAAGTTDGSASGSSPEGKAYKVGVVEAMANDESVIRRYYYEKYIAPKYNVKFVFSEQCTSDEAEQTFIENSIDAGVNAIITYRGDNIKQMLDYCAKNKVYYATNGTIPDGFDPSKNEYFVGRFGGDVGTTANLFSDWLMKSASKDGSEGFLICSALAFRKNVQHYPSTIALLNVLKAKYGLTFTDTVENLALSKAPTEVKNDKGISIMVYPGSPMQSDAWLPGVTALLQSGKYGTIMHMGQYFPNTSVIVKEVEQTFNKDIKVASVASMSKSLTNIFNTPDKFGNPSLDMAAVKSVSMIAGIGFARVYNALTGFNSANVGVSGKKDELMTNFFSIENAKDSNSISDWDINGGVKWIADYSVIDKMLGAKNKSITFETIKAYALISISSVLSR